jgi:hypothetical protein
VLFSRELRKPTWPVSWLPVSWREPSFLWPVLQRFSSAMPFWALLFRLLCRPVFWPVALVFFWQLFFPSRQSPWIAREFWPFWPVPFLWLFFSLRFFWFVLLPFRLSRSGEDAPHPMPQEAVLQGKQDSPELFHKLSGLSIDYSSFNVKRRCLLVFNKA